MMLLKIVVVTAGYHALVGLAYLLFGTLPASILLMPHRLVRDIFVKLFIPDKVALWKKEKEAKKIAKQLAIATAKSELKAATEELNTFLAENAAVLEKHKQLRKKLSETDESLWEAKHQFATADKGFQGICAG